MSNNSDLAGSERTTRREHLKIIGGVGTAGLVGLAGCSGDGGNGGSEGGDGGSDGGDGGSDGGDGGSDGGDGGSDGGDGENVITFGGTYPLTGSSASTGEAYRIGYEAAVQKINSMGGVPIGDTNYLLELDVQDDASTPDRAQSITQEQINQNGYDFFLGSFGSSVVLPQAAIINQNEKVLVQGGGGSDEIFTQGWDWSFGMFPRATRQIRNPGNFFRNEVQPETASMVFENDPFSKFFAQGFRTEFEKESAPEWAGEHEVPRDAQSFSSVMTSVENESPELLVTTTHSDNTQQVQSQIATQDLNFDAVYHSLGPNQVGYRETLGEDTDYVFTSTYWTAEASYSGEVFESAAAFDSYVRENFDAITADGPFDYHIATGAACIIAYYHAFNNAGSTDPEAVRDALDELSLSGDESFYGPIEFTEDGDGNPTKLGAAVQQMIDGSLEIVFPLDVATADYVYPSPDWSER